MLIMKNLLWELKNKVELGNVVTDFFVNLGGSSLDTQCNGFIYETEIPEELLQED